jgi:hypothetical protein
MGCRGLHLSVRRDTRDRRSHHSWMINTFRPWPIPNPTFLITHKRYFTPCPFAGGTMRDGGLQVFLIFLDWRRLCNWNGRRALCRLWGWTASRGRRVYFLPIRRLRLHERSTWRGRSRRLDFGRIRRVHTARASLYERPYVSEIIKDMVIEGLHTAMTINSSKSKTGLLTVLQQDQDLRPSWNTYHLRWSGEKGVM